MELGDWRHELLDDANWLSRFGTAESPVVIAAMDPATQAAIRAIEAVLAGRGVRSFILGPTGSGKSALISAFLAQAGSLGLDVATVSSTTDPSVVGRLVRGDVPLLAVSGMESLSPSVQSGIVANRHKCSIGLIAGAERLSAVNMAALTDPLDVVIELPTLQNRPRDVLALSQLVWPDVCAASSDLLGHCKDDAAEALSRGPYAHGAKSLRRVLEQLADALITAGDLIDGAFRRQVDSGDVTQAVLASIRAERPLDWSASAEAVIIVEGATDMKYFVCAARLAEEAWGWKLLDGCKLVPAGEEREGGAQKVWVRLIEYTSQALDCLGLFDNDDVGRSEHSKARGLNLRVEVIPAEFDRLRLPEPQRCLEIEDLLCLGILDRFYEEHHELEPEERRERLGGRRRVVPQGVDKDVLVEWACREMNVTDCERLIYLLYRLRRAVGLPTPREDLDPWLRELIAADC